MNEEQAIELVKSGWWKNKNNEEIVSFQLYEDRICMPFSEVHKAVEKVLKRPVWTHEFGTKGIEILKAEFEGKIPKRTVKESMEPLREIVGKEKVILAVSH